MTHETELSADPPLPKLSRQAETLLILACSLLLVPFVCNNGLYWDDWSLFWTFWVEGPPRLLQLYREVGHIGHWLPVALLYQIGGGYAGILAKAVAVVCHVANAFLFYRIFNEINLTSEISVWIASLYVLSPFYYGRGLLVLSVSDLFLLCYLVSIWLLCFRQRLAPIAALLFLVLSLGHETFVFLEPLRVLFVWETRKDLRKTIRLCAPFWVIAGTFAVLRVTLLKPYGYAAGYNQVNLDIPFMFKVFASTVLFYFRAIWFNMNSALSLAGWYGIATVVVVGLFLAWMLTSRHQSSIFREPATLDLTIRRMRLGLFLAFLGALPYLLIGRSPHPNYFSSRFAVVSIPGVLICLTSLIAYLPGRFLRVYALVLILAVAGLSSLHLTKWYLYESLVKRDLIMQLNDGTSNLREEPIRIVLEFVPKTPDVALLRRTVSAYDLNVPVNMLRDPSWPPVFIQDVYYYQEVERVRPMDEHCVITGTPYPCPSPPIRLRYTLHPDKSSVGKMPFLELIRLSCQTLSVPPGIGVITVESVPRDFQWQVKPPRGRNPMMPGGEIVLSILGFRPYNVNDLVEF